MGGKVSDLKGKLAAIFSKNFNSFVVPFVSCVVLGPIWKDFVYGVSVNWTETLPNPNTDRSLDYMWCHLHENSNWGLKSQNDRRRVLVNVCKLRKEKISDRGVGVLQQGTPTWRSHTKPVLGGTFCRITRPQDITQPWDFDMLFTYSSSTRSHFLDLIYWMVCYFIFTCVARAPRIGLSKNGLRQ